MDLTPGMPQGWDVEWLNSKFNVPEGAFDFSLAFSNEEQTVFDNNDDNDYVARVGRSYMALHTLAYGLIVSPYTQKIIFQLLLVGV